MSRAKVRAAPWTQGRRCSGSLATVSAGRVGAGGGVSQSAGACGRPAAREVGPPGVRLGGLLAEVVGAEQVAAALAPAGEPRKPRRGPLEQAQHRGGLARVQADRDVQADAGLPRVEQAAEQVVGNPVEPGRDALLGGDAAGLLVDGEGAAGAAEHAAQPVGLGRAQHQPDTGAAREGAGGCHQAATSPSPVAAGGTGATGIGMAPLGAAAARATVAAASAVRRRERNQGRSRTRTGGRWP